MKKLMILFALIMGVVSVKAQSNDLYQGITKKLPYRQMVTPLRRTGDIRQNGTYYFPVCREVRGFRQ